MIDLEIFEERLLLALQQEHNWLSEVRPMGVFSLPKPVLRFLAARVFLHNQHHICPECNLKWNSSISASDTHDIVLHFTIQAAENEQNIYLNIQTAHVNDNLFGRIGAMMQLNENGEKIAVTILQTNNAAELEQWQHKWQTAFSENLLPVKNSVAINNEKTLWLVMWKITSPGNQISADKNYREAMTEAVRNMQYENMFSVIKKIIALRTNLDETKMTEDVNLHQLFKLVFAKEQGVSPDEVYDPEAFAGLTDSQIAAGNLVDDLQKAFNIFLADHEVKQIVTLRDLVGSILAKKW